MARHILDFPNEITERIMVLGCETNALQWFYPDIYKGCSSLDQAFPPFEELEHPCIQVMSNVCWQWKMSATSFVKRCEWSRFKRLKLHAEPDSKNPDLADRINKFVRTLQLSSLSSSSSSEDTVPLYVTLWYPDESNMEETSIRLFLYCVGTMLLFPKHIMALDIELPTQTEYSATHLFWLFVAFSKLSSKLSFVTVNFDSRTLRHGMSAALKTTIDRSLGIHRYLSILSTASELCQMENFGTQTGDHDYGKHNVPSSLSVSPGIRNGIACCLRILGTVKLLNDNEGAAGMLVAGRILFESLENRSDAMHCLRILGDVKRQQHEYDEARNALEEARVGFESVGDRSGAASCLWSLGNLKCTRRDYKGAVETLMKALHELEPLGYRGLVADCLQSLGDAMRLLNNYDEATWVLEAARAEYDLLGDRGSSAQCTMVLGNVKRMQGDYEAARELIMKAKMEFESLREDSYSRGNVADCLMNLGHIKRLQGDYKGAVELLEKARIEFESLGNIRRATECLQGLGSAKHMGWDFDGAFKVFIETRIKFESFGDTDGVAECLRQLGVIKYMLGSYEEATKMLTEAMIKYQSLGNTIAVTECLRELATVKWLRKD